MTTQPMCDAFGAVEGGCMMVQVQKKAQRAADWILGVAWADDKAAAAAG